MLGLNEGVNVFFEDDGVVIGTPYIPAYIRRYPFLLAKLDQNSDNLSLCFDPQSDLVGQFDDGSPLFVDAKDLPQPEQSLDEKQMGQPAEPLQGLQPSQHTRDVLQFCEKFEEAGAKTQAFVKELKDAGLLMDGEVSINRGDSQDQPFIYRGFQMIDQKKLREMRGDQLRKWNENGMLPLIHAHLFSLDMMRVIFAKQVQQGKAPQPVANVPGMN